MSADVRAATAVPLALACVAGVYFLPTAALAACLGIVVVLAAWEWSALAGIHGRAARGIYVAALAGIGFAMVPWVGNAPALVLVVPGVVFWSLALALVILAELGRFDLRQWPLFRVAAGVLVLLPAWLSLVYLHAARDGTRQVLFLLVLIWCADIAAYIVGRAWGRVRLCPGISPGKSREGALAGICTALVIGLLFGVIQNLAAPAMVRFALIAAATAAVSIVGDLFESMLKRSANMKDSGTLLPGHGGILDRIDSLTAAAPVYLLGVQVAAGPP